MLNHIINTLGYSLFSGDLNVLRPNSFFYINRTENPNPFGIFSESQLWTVISWSRFLYERNYLAAGFVDALINFIGKPEVNFISLDKTDKESAAIARKFWRKFTEVNNWSETQWSTADTSIREIEARRRLIRDGEVWIRFFIEDGFPTIRFLEPEQIRTPGVPTSSEYDHSWGIVTPINDRERYLGYWVYYPRTKKDSFDNFDFVKPLFIVRTKINTDRSIKRGLPDLYPLDFSLANLSEIIYNLQTTASAQAAIAWVEKHATSHLENVSKIIDSNSQGFIPRMNPFNQRIDSVPVVKHPAGTVLATSSDKQYEPGPSNTAQSFIQLIELSLKCIGWRWNYPDWFTNGAQSFAAALVTGAPFARAIAARQEHYKHFISSFVYTALYIGEKLGLIPKITNKIRPVISFPPIVIADEQAQISIWEKEVSLGVMDEIDWMSKRGRKVDEVIKNKIRYLKMMKEVKKLEAELEKLSKGEEEPKQEELNTLSSNPPGSSYIKPLEETIVKNENTEDITEDGDKICVQNDSGSSYLILKKNFDPSKHKPCGKTQITAKDRAPTKVEEAVSKSYNSVKASLKSHVAETIGVDASSSKEEFMAAVEKYAQEKGIDENKKQLMKDAITKSFDKTTTSAEFVIAVKMLHELKHGPILSENSIKEIDGKMKQKYNEVMAKVKNKELSPSEYRREVSDIAKELREELDKQLGKTLDEVKSILNESGLGMDNSEEAVVRLLVQESVMNEKLFEVANKMSPEAKEAILLSSQGSRETLFNTLTALNVSYDQLANISEEQLKSIIDNKGGRIKIGTKYYNSEEASRVIKNVSNTVNLEIVAAKIFEDTTGSIQYEDDNHQVYSSSFKSRNFPVFDCVSLVRNKQTGKIKICLISNKMSVGGSINHKHHRKIEEMNNLLGEIENRLKNGKDIRSSFAELKGNENFEGRNISKEEEMQELQKEINHILDSMGIKNVDTKNIEVHSYLSEYNALLMPDSDKNQGMMNGLRISSAHYSSRKELNNMPRFDQKLADECHESALENIKSITAKALIKLDGKSENKLMAQAQLKDLTC